MGILSRLGLTSWQDPNMPRWKDNRLQGNRISCNTTTILNHKKTKEINSNQYLIDYKHARYQFCDASYSQAMGFTRNSVHWCPDPWAKQPYFLTWWITSSLFSTFAHNFLFYRHMIIQVIFWFSSTLASSKVCSSFRFANNYWVVLEQRKYSISLISSLGILFFSSYWDGEATIQGGQTRGHLFFVITGIAPNFMAHSFAYSADWSGTTIQCFIEFLIFRQTHGLY